MLLWATFDQNSVIARVKILKADSTTGEGLTGLTSGSSGLNISTIADSEASATAYSGSNIESITTLGTYAAPTSGKCRFKEVDSTNHPGVYELQFADARFSVSAAKSLIISIKGATNAAECDAVIPLPVINLFDANAVPSASAVADAVWDEALSGHTTAGSAGKALSDVGTSLATIASGVASLVTNVATLLTRISSALSISGGKVSVEDSEDGVSFARWLRSVGAVAFGRSVVTGPGGGTHVTYLDQNNDPAVENDMNATRERTSSGIIPP
jgi:hypothetical protein